MSSSNFTPEEKQFGILFFVIVLLELITASVPHLEIAHYIAKPAIVGSLIFAFFKFSGGLEKGLIPLMFGALIFSMLGDIVLMFVDNWSHAFSFGLIAFLIAHILYSFAFWKQRVKNKLSFLILLPFLAYGIIIFFYLEDNLGPMKIPVCIYMLIIILMATLAFHRKGSVSPLSFWLVFIGALFFIISDSLLAINKFANPLPLSNISIMATYALAQFCIVFGILKSKV